MRTPCSLWGTRAASTTFVKTRGDRDSPKGRTLYLYARPSNANRRKVARKDRHMEVRVLQVDRCRPISGTDASEDALLREHLERRFMKGLVQDVQTQDRS